MAQEEEQRASRLLLAVARASDFGQVVLEPLPKKVTDRVLGRTYRHPSGRAARCRPGGKQGCHKLVMLCEHCQQKEPSFPNAEGEPRRLCSSCSKAAGVFGLRDVTQSWDEEQCLIAAKILLKCANSSSTVCKNRYEQAPALAFAELLPSTPDEEPLCDTATARENMTTARTRTQGDDRRPSHDCGSRESLTERLVGPLTDSSNSPAAAPAPPRKRHRGAVTDSSNSSRHAQHADLTISSGGASTARCSLADSHYRTSLL